MQSPSRKAPSANAGNHRTVLPAELPADARKALRRALGQKALAHNIKWVFERFGPEANFLELMDQFIQRYERQVGKAVSDDMNGYMPVLRAGLAYRLLDALKPYRMTLADQAVNPLFVETFLKKRLLAEMMGITTQDVQRKIMLSGRKPVDFLNEEVGALIPETCLKQL